MTGRILHCISYLILPGVRESYRFRGLGNTSGRGNNITRWNGIACRGINLRVKAFRATRNTIIQLIGVMFLQLRWWAVIGEAFPRITYACGFSIFRTRCPGYCSRKQTRIEPGFDEDVEPEGRQGWRAADNNSSVDFDKSTSSQIVCAWEPLLLFTYVVMATLIPSQIGSFPRKTLTL